MLDRADRSYYSGMNPSSQHYNGSTGPSNDSQADLEALGSDHLW
jgi:hypothetical protein